MNHKLNQKKTWIFVFLAFFVFASNAFGYTPMEAIPGFGKPTDFPTYLMSLYKFGLWAIGLSAMLMISIGGYMYLTSAGNNSRTGKAKGIITDAIIGIILAMASYILLYTINPELLKFNPLAGKSTGTGTTSTTTTGTTVTSSNKGYRSACPNTDSLAPIDFSKSIGNNSIQPNSNCDNLNFSNSYGVDQKILKTIAQIESSCGANKNMSSAGACGIMQLLPTTAGKSCNDLISDDTGSIELAAKYISDNKSIHGNNLEKILAGYNGGYATTGKGPLATSVDCPGSLKFQCCKDPGELDETIGYVWNGVALKNKL